MQMNWLMAVKCYSIVIVHQLLCWGASTDVLDLHQLSGVKMVLPTLAIFSCDTRCFSEGWPWAPCEHTRISLLFVKQVSSLGSTEDESTVADKYDSTADF